MRTLITTTLVAFAVLLNAQVENGCISIDFESFPDETPSSGLILSDQYEDAFGLSFRLEGGGFPVLAQVGGNVAEAFGSAWGNDTPAPGVDIGQFFLTDDGQLSGLTSPAIILDFEIPIDSFAGCILDMDFEEFFIIQALDASGNVILEERIDAGDPNTGDGELTCWGFNLPGCEGSIYSIKYAGFRPDSSPGAFGLGMDYFSFCYSGLQIDIETTPVTCDGLGSINIFSTTNEVYEYSLDGLNYSLNGFFDQLDSGSQLVYVRDSDNCTTSVDVFVELDTEELPDPIFVEEEICSGQSYSFNGVEYFDAGVYQQTLNAPNGCDTLWNLTLSVLPISSSIIFEEICDGATYELNGQSYSMEGTYEQILITSLGCDSIIEINLNVNFTTEEFFSAQICEGESYILNGENYTSSGIYIQQMINQFGCDSLLTLELEVQSTTLGNISAELCEGDAFELNGQSYNSQGTYIQMLINEVGCDSILSLELEFFDSSFGTLSEEICDGSDITINGTIYDAAGTYSQNLMSSSGCDSLLNITINVLPTIETCENINITEGEAYTLNGETYTTAGTYEQLLQTDNGCDSLVIIKLDVIPLSTAIVYYDLNDCAAGGSSYNEFVPRYNEGLECAAIEASILNRPSGLTHSCTPGEDGSGMCISSDPSCDYQNDSVHRMLFEVQINPTSGPVRISELRFFEKAPIRYQFNAGGSGVNNYPTLYSIRIYKDGTEIFSNQAVSTNREWTLQSFNFNGLGSFLFDGAGILTVEFLAYCPIGIASNVSAWDIDELSLLAYCQPDGSRVLGKVMTTRDEPLEETSIAVRDTHGWTYYTSDADGEFAFDVDYNYSSTLIAPFNDSDPLNGVSTLDLLYIQKHILGSESILELPKLVAADINKDNRITAIDLIELRKMILGVHENFPNNTSWRFLDAEYQYAALADINDQIVITDLDKEISLKGIKVGDVNQSHTLEVNSSKVEARAQDNFKFVVREYRDVNGELRVEFIASENANLAGFQSAFIIENYRNIKLVPHVLNITENDFYHKNDDVFKISWISQNGKIIAGDLLFEIVIEEEQKAAVVQLDKGFENEIYHAIDFRKQPLILDKEGNDKYSEEEIIVNVYPNPFSDVSKVQIISKEEIATKYEVYDATGQLLISESISLKKGMNKLDFNSRVFPGSGIYFMVIHKNDHAIIERIVLL